MMPEVEPAIEAVLELGKIAMNYFETDKAGYDDLHGLIGTISAVKVM